jgi:hypothetical protein
MTGTACTAMNRRVAASASILFLSLVACGGGSDPPPATTDPGDAQRSAAARTTAETNPLCSVAALKSYYWEIGNKDGVLASGNVGPGHVGPDTLMGIASSSKWLFAAYVLEKHGNVVTNVAFLNFTSGYSNLDNALCSSSDTVSGCMNGGVNATEAAARALHYQGGHMQQLAISLGLGALRNVTLAAEVRSGIGNDVGLVYVEFLLPGGAATSARSYAVFLRKLLIDSSTPLRMGAALGSRSVCTQPSATCNASPDTAAAIPEDVHYSLGHWVEDDPTATPSSNFAYSSAGKFGFYPWVDFDRRLYGIIAREDPTETTGEGYSSLRCGRLIRLAWKTGVAQ